MNYNAIADMSQSNSLRSRVTACAAESGKPDPSTWSGSRMWQISASPGWNEAWANAVDNLNVNQNPDIGARTDVITDAMILAAVQAAV